MQVCLHRMGYQGIDLHLVGVFGVLVVKGTQVVVFGVVGERVLEV